jgi:hypothetical protein
MKAFQAANFPELFAMRARARPRRLMANAAIAAGLCGILAMLFLLVSLIHSLQMIVERIYVWVGPSLPSITPVHESTVYWALRLMS